MSALRKVNFFTGEPAQDPKTCAPGLYLGQWGDTFNVVVKLHRHTDPAHWAYEQQWVSIDGTIGMTEPSTRVYPITTKPSES